MIYVFLADGFEEIEALTPVDMLRRAGIETVTVGIGGRVVTGGHDIVVTADIEDSQVRFAEMEGIILPGGLQGTENLDRSQVVQDAITHCVGQHKWIAAICAAPSILGRRGLLNGRSATAFPTVQKELTGAQITQDSVVCDGRFITAKGMGVSIDFGAAIITALKSREAADAVKAQIQCPA